MIADVCPDISCETTVVWIVNEILHLMHENYILVGLIFCLKNFLLVIS